ncbi:hypothetical protein [Microbacterium sp. NPDC089695]|uniref:NAD(P)H-dependent amine dehydrogenase family protein n=1 Tax=Microbacterium sp. NPDC089695 TaxID=3364198 RepID=UPI0037F53616
MTVSVIIQGFGAMGREILAALAARTDADVIAVLDTDATLVGRRLGEVVGTSRWPDVVVRHPDEVRLGDLRADVAVHATTAFVDVAVPQIAALLDAGADVVTLCQELVYPREENADLAADLHRTAVAAGRTVVAGGVNPGWILDLLPIAASLGCRDIDAVRATRVVDFSPYGPDEMVHIGAGLDEDRFRAGADSGEIGHIGLLESARMVADALGLDVDRWEQTKDPVISPDGHATPFADVAPGHVRGFRQRVRGWTGDRLRADFEMVGLIDVRADDPELGDRIAITATPDIAVTVQGGDTTDGGTSTAGVVTNLIGPALASGPGLRTIADLPLTRSRTTLRLPASVS